MANDTTFDSTTFVFSILDLTHTMDVEIAALNCRNNDGSTLKISSARGELLLLLEDEKSPFDDDEDDPPPPDVIETLNVVGLDKPKMTGPISELATSANSSTAY